MAYPETMSQRDMQAKAMKSAYNDSASKGTLGRGFGGPNKAKILEVVAAPVKKAPIAKAITKLKK